jgi:hypothetical protein
MTTPQEILDRIGTPGERARLLAEQRSRTHARRQSGQEDPEAYPDAHELRDLVVDALQNWVLGQKCAQYGGTWNVTSPKVRERWAIELADGPVHAVLEALGVVSPPHS